MFGLSIDTDGVKSFEEDQRKHGTQVALFNFVFMLCDTIMRNLGVGKFSVRKVDPKHVPATKAKK
jgi:hypothetical protein